MKPKFKIELFPKELTPGKSGWDSEQFVVLLKTLDKLDKRYSWQASDVWFVTKNPNKLSSLKNDQSGKPYWTGDNETVLSEVEKTTYFYSGVFLGYNSTPDDPVEIFTEDDGWRDIGKAVIEIRLFDTSTIEVYSLDRNLLNQILEGLTLDKKIQERPTDI